MKYEIELDALPFPKKDAILYISKIRNDLAKFLKYYENALYLGLRRDENNVALENEENVIKIWNRVLSSAYDNANDIGMDALNSKEIDVSEWEAYADKFVGASVEGIINEINGA